MPFSLECAFAAQWWGYKLEEFDSLPVDEQEYLIAVFRAYHLIQGVSGREG